MPVKANLIGRTFGRLQVVGLGGRDRRDRRLWRCFCSCETTHYAPTDKLLSGELRSCGCLLTESRASRALDISGVVFGRLTAIQKVGRRERGNAEWRCNCICGQEKDVLLVNLRSGGTTSCGCARKERITVRTAEFRAQACVSSHNRRAREVGAGGRLTVKEVERLYARQKGKCAEPSCRVRLGAEYHRDHAMPLVLGGSNGVKNIQLLCSPCNLRKHAKHPLDWARENGRLL